MPLTIGLIILVLFILVITLSSIKIIKQSSVGIVMRLGKFSRKAETGVNFILPFIERIYTIVDLRESVLDFPPQPVITKDNVTMQIDTVVYYKVTDPVNFIFEIANPLSAIENLTATTLRNIIGELDLDETLTSRDVVNTKLRAILDEATDKWGIKVNRVELKNILPPRDIQDAMEKQMRAERQRREAVLRAEGEKAAAILEAEGNKESAILRAEAEKEALIHAAEGQRQASILKAQGEAEAILQIQNAKAEGTKAILLAMKDAGVDDQVLALRSMEALEKIAEGDASKLILPSDAVNFLGTFKGIKEVMSDQ
ncbi:SPFH/Band 7/PHB domain protein [Niameybacter massiliensis]|uniref:SPFH/Band 7/PHB domain protein n=1 Tax=Holtiella tumoricola TaxID=3018743 RepID=A0AA42DPR3_9FIRM|nr:MULTISPECIES: SPFH domain-containing protein [Lachnospirales]MDA3732576.1 SPFH/Band 7/PHB domain protein [Holtiella tumoricola]